MSDAHVQQKYDHKERDAFKAINDPMLKENKKECMTCTYAHIKWRRKSKHKNWSACEIE